MKMRDGFVSNSSSSSFIAIGRGNLYPPTYAGEPLIIGDCGCIEFGWGPARYSDFGSKLNFAYLQTTYMSEPQKEKCFKMLQKVLLEDTQCTEIVIKISTEYPRPPDTRNAYIDHRSCATEDANTEMFKNEGELRHFLFCNDSIIVESS